ncbi:MAG: hypothetical protein C4582_06880 [Desulfobacteraceae bacterium]|jgi:hypothetical protein|nr:MAG: hypothetical protein C4582_06880 [Desulfobacteraceae bacterium]
MDKQLSGKDSRDLFREIDALCDEVNSATPNVNEAEEIAIGCFQNSVEITEGFALAEFLLEHDFVILSTAKTRRDKDPR